MSSKILNEVSFANCDQKVLEILDMRSFKRLIEIYNVDKLLLPKRFNLEKLELLSMSLNYVSSAVSVNHILIKWQGSSKTA